MVPYIGYGVLRRLKCKVPKLFLFYHRALTVINRVITTPEHIRIFHSDTRDHQKCKSGNAGWLFHQILGDCLGLINGSRWETLRSPLSPLFSHEASMSRLMDTSAAARSYIDTLSQHSRCKQTDDAGSLVLHASSTFMKFPFFHTAGIIYGALTPDLQEELWEIGQSRLAIMRYVVTGGIYRFKASKWFAGGALRELEQFQGRWYDFNHKIYAQKALSASALPIVSLWQSTIISHSTEKEVTSPVRTFIDPNH